MASPCEGNEVGKPAYCANRLISPFTIVTPHILALNPVGIEEDVGGKGEVKATTAECRFTLCRIPFEIHGELYVSAV